MKAFDQFLKLIATSTFGLLTIGLILVGGKSSVKISDPGWYLAVIYMSAICTVYSLKKYIKS